MAESEKLRCHKGKIKENIDYAKSAGINKVSALLTLQGKEGDEVEKELVTWLILDGYKVSLRKEEISILTIEWDV